MGTFNVSSSAFSDPRFLDAGPRAVALWTTCGSWRASWMTNPDDLTFIPAALVKMSGARKPDAEALVRAGLWTVSTERAGYFMELRGDLWDLSAQGRRRERISDRIRGMVYDRDGHRCVECASDVDLSIDHIYPHSLGGADTPDNLQTLCMSCNNIKGVSV